MSSVKEKLEGSKEDFDRDVQEIKETIKNEEWNTKRKVKHTFRTNKNKVIILLIAVIFGILIFNETFGQVEIPTWTYLVGFSMLGAGIVTYPIAQKIAKLFVEDNRAYMLELPSEGFDVYKIPSERIETIEFTHGDKHETKTHNTNARAIEIRRFEKVQEKGREKLIGQGIWEGTKTNSDIKRTWDNVQAMRENLVPQAQRAREYDSKMPYWIHKMENEIINMITYQFEKEATYNGADIHQEIKQEMGIDETMNEKEEKEQNSIEEMNEKLEKMSKVMQNGGME